MGWEDLNRRVLDQDGAELLHTLFPGGRVIGRKYIMTNPTIPGAPVDSFSIDIDTWVWKDEAFEGPSEERKHHCGFDPISLYAYLRGINKFARAKRALERALNRYLGGSHG